MAATEEREFRNTSARCKWRVATVGVRFFMGVFARSCGILEESRGTTDCSLDPVAFEALSRTILTPSGSVNNSGWIVMS